MLKIVANSKEYFFEDIAFQEGPRSGHGIIKNRSKVKLVSSVDDVAIASMQEFLDATVTEARLQQGFDFITKEMGLEAEMKSMGDFIRWVYNDVVKEEADLIVAKQLDAKKLGSAIANRSRPWYQTTVLSSV